MNETDLKYFKETFEDILFTYKNSVKEINNIKDLYNLASLENNEEIKDDCIFKIEEITKEIKRSETKCFLSGENDHLNIF